MVGPQPRRSQPRLPPKLVVAKVALTGGTGFLGSNIAEVLGTAGHDVLVLTRATPTMAVPWMRAYALNVQEFRIQEFGAAGGRVLRAIC